MPKPRVHSTGGAQARELDEIFGESQRFIPSYCTGPKFRGYTQSQAWENKVLDYTPREWDKIGNVRIIYHGTNRESIKYIAIQSLLPGGKKVNSRRRRSSIFGGLFGLGIYVAPRAIKAWNHSGNWYDREAKKNKKYLLKGRVALGKILEPRTEGDQRNRVISSDCNSIVAKAGTEVRGLWGGRASLVYTEYVVYDPIQIVIDYVFEYEEILVKRACVPTYYAVRGKKELGIRDVELHPCRKEDRLCRNAYGTGGCIAKNKKKGITKENFEFCDSYR